MAVEAEGDDLDLSPPRFTATVNGSPYHRKQVLYGGDSLPAAVEAVNRWLAEAEAGGALDHLVERVPRRMDLREVWRQLEVLRRKVDEERGVSRARRHGPIEQIRCPTLRARRRRALASKGRGRDLRGHPRGSAGAMPGRAKSAGEDGRQGEREAEVTVFASADDRLVRLAESGVYRERDESLRELMREQYWLLGHGRGSEEDFEQAYTGIEKAIGSLPCKSCGAVCWPVIRSPKEGSAEWWDDPFADFHCRVCGRYLDHVGSGSSSAESSREYPFRPPRLPSPPLQATM